MATLTGKENRQELELMIRYSYKRPRRRPEQRHSKRLVVDETVTHELDYPTSLKYLLGELGIPPPCVSGGA